MNAGQAFSASRAVRWVFAVGTIASFGLGVVGGDARWFGVSGFCGLVWWLWDLFVEHIASPIGHWLSRAVTGQLGHADTAHLRPSLDDLIRLLEGHVEQGASRQVEINSAMRLSEIYRTVKKDPQRAREVIDRIRTRYPDAPELDALAKEISAEDAPS